MNLKKMMTAIVLTASLVSVPAFAQQSTATPASASQVIANQGLDIYVDGASVAAGALPYSNTIVTLSTRGSHTVTAYAHGVAPSTGSPVSTITYFATMPTQIVHVVTDSADSVSIY